MTVTDHPQLDLLKDYLNNTESAEFVDLRLHLAQCSDCRSLLQGLSSLQSIATQLEADELDDHEHQQIMDYIDGRLDSDKQQVLKQKIDSNASLMKAALHYAGHKASMDRAELASISTETEKILPSGRSGLLTKIVALFRFEAPVWLTVPVTAAIVALFSSNLLRISDGDVSDYILAAYQDDPVILFHSRQQVPGIGFFAQPAEISQTYDNLNVSVSTNQDFHIQWSSVEKARNYTLRLQVFDQGQKRTVAEVTTDKTAVVISPRLDKIEYRYEWTLSGNTEDSRSFLTKGGFVIDAVE